MLRLIVLVATVIVLAKGATLRITPDELRVAWQTIEDDVRARQNVTLSEILATHEPMSIFAKDAKAKINNDITSSAKPYWEAIFQLEMDNLARDLDISPCDRPANEELWGINATLIVTHFHEIDKVASEAMAEVDEAMFSTFGALTVLDKIGHQIRRCAEDWCATQLEVEAVEFYRWVVVDLQQASERANNAALVKLPLHLEEKQLDKEKYVAEWTRLLNQVKACVQAMTGTTIL